MEPRDKLRRARRAADLTQDELDAAVARQTGEPIGKGRCYAYEAGRAAIAEEYATAAARVLFANESLAPWFYDPDDLVVPTSGESSTYELVGHLPGEGESEDPSERRDNTIAPPGSKGRRVVDDTYAPHILRGDVILYTLAPTRLGHGTIGIAEAGDPARGRLAPSLVVGDNQAPSGVSPLAPDGLGDDRRVIGVAVAIIREHPSGLVAIRAARQGLSLAMLDL